MTTARQRALQFSISKRVHTGKCMTTSEALCYLAAHSALAAATGYFLWHPVESKDGPLILCNDPYTVATDSMGNNYLVP